MHINKKSLENFFLVFSLTLFLCVVIMPRAVSHFLVPDTKAETIQIYMEKTEELYQDILKDAEKGKTKNITDYSFTMLADSTFLQDSAFTEALLYNPLPDEVDRNNQLPVSGCHQNGILWQI